jgi:hypothetical protein
MVNWAKVMSKMIELMVNRNMVDITIMTSPIWPWGIVIWVRRSITSPISVSSYMTWSGSSWSFSSGSSCGGGSSYSWLSCCCCCCGCRGGSRSRSWSSRVSSGGCWGWGWCRSLSSDSWSSSADRSWHSSLDNWLLLVLFMVSMVWGWLGHADGCE